MTRSEAESLIGQRVEVWTAANGTYVGVLEEVKATRPWRGVVLIDGVLKCAQLFEYGRTRQRRGKRPGERIEAGGVNIRPTEATGGSYREALEWEIGWMSKITNPLFEKFIAEAQRQLAEEPITTEAQQ